MNETVSPELKAEIEKQVIEAEIAGLKSGGLEFAGDAIADNALLTEGSLVNSMQMASDPGSRDKVTLYSTDTGMPSRVLMNMLGKKLGQRLPDGRRAWSTTPTKEYFVGSTLCLLHPEHSRRKELDGIGLVGKTCMKSNIPSEFEVRQHMLKRHKQEWSVMEEARERAEKDEERAFRRLQMEQWERMNTTRRGRPPKDEEMDV